MLSRYVYGVLTLVCYQSEVREGVCHIKQSRPRRSRMKENPKQSHVPTRRYAALKLVVVGVLPLL